MRQHKGESVHAVPLYNVEAALQHRGSRLRT